MSASAEAVDRGRHGRDRVALPDEAVAYDDADELVTGEAVALTIRPTGFALRAASAVIDTLLSWAVFVGILLALDSTRVLEGLPGQLVPAVIITVVVLAFVVGPLAVELASRGRSLGRLAVGARIVRDDGGAITFRHAFIRTFVGFIELVVLAGGPAALVGFLTRRTKRIGDLLAGTYAQYERVPRELPPVWGVPEPLRAWATTADVGRLPDALSRRIRQFLAQAPRMIPQRRDQLARGLANEASRWVSPIPVGAPAELFLAAITVLRRDRDAAALRREADGLERLAPALRGLPHAFPDRG